MDVRPAGPGDAERWVETYLEAMAAAYATLMPPEFAVLHRGRYAELVESRRQVFAEPPLGGEEQPDPADAHRGWLAEDDTGVVAVAEAGPGPAAWELEWGFRPPSTTRELHRLYALPRAHGSGVGQALLDVAIGDGPAYLWIVAGNARAEAFYRRNRFVPDGVRGRGGPAWFGRTMIRMHRS